MILNKIISKLCYFYSSYFIILAAILLDLPYQTIFKNDLTSYNQIDNKITIVAESVMKF